MTEALKRGSNIEQAVPKYLVIPQDREDQLRRKLRSPLFAERFENDCWRGIFCERLEKEFLGLKAGNVSLDSLTLEKIIKPHNRSARDHKQLDLLATEGLEQL
jgi:hypothetical protein